MVHSIYWHLQKVATARGITIMRMPQVTINDELTPVVTHGELDCAHSGAHTSVTSAVHAALSAYYAERAMEDEA